MVLLEKNEKLKNGLNKRCGPLKKKKNVLKSGKALLEKSKKLENVLKKH